jgi:hypothetical protein
LRIPKSLKIAGKRWRIRFVEGLSSKGTKLFGLCHYDDRLIELAPDSNRARLAKTLIHEVIGHALPHEIGFRDEYPGEHKEELFAREVERLVARFFHPKVSVK